MKIGVDIRVLARGARTGVEEYVINLLSHLLPLEPSINYLLFYNAYRKVDLDYPWLDLNNVTLKDFKIPNRPLFFLTRYLNQPKIDKLLKGIDIYFNPHFFNAPVKNCRKVITFHDLSFIRYPEYFSLRKRFWQKFLINAKREAREADKIIAVSESTKDDLINLFKIKQEKIKVIYSGVSEQFKPIQKIKKNYHLPERFILYFGTIEPRKNITGLIKAFELLKDKEIKLVIAGAKGWLYQDIFKTASNSKRRNDIFFTGFVREEDKPYLYNLAELFVYPSFFEGFGFPPLEAMACGIPTIVSNTSSLPEVVEKAGIMVNPYDIDEMAWAMEMVLSDRGLKERMEKEGIEQAKKFDWNKTAKETLELFKLCA